MDKPRNTGGPHSAMSRLGKWVAIGAAAGCLGVGCIALVLASPFVKQRFLETARTASTGMHGHNVSFDRVEAPAAAVAKGPLRVSAANGRYFSDGDGRAVLLAGDHTWYTLQDGGREDPPGVFDYPKYLEFLQANNINFFRMFVWEQAEGSVGITTPWHIWPLPYSRTGPGLAADGKLRFDLTKFNEEYFTRLRTRVIEAGVRGIYVAIQLFDGFSVQKKPFMAANNPWRGHPFRQGNNINAVDADLNENGEGDELETLAASEVTRLQDAYVEKIIDAVNDLDNVLFEVCNEAHSGSSAWQEHIVRHIHQYEATKPKRHVVGRTIEWPNGKNDPLFRTEAEWISPNAEGGFFDNPPSADGTKVIVNDTDHLCFPCGDRIWAWKTFTRGMNPAFMDPYDCRAEWSPTNCDPNKPAWVSLRATLGRIVGWSKRIDLSLMKPNGSLASTGYCLANPVADAAEYLVYLPSPGSVTVDLSATPGDLEVEWFDPVTGVSVFRGAYRGGKTRLFASPFREDSVLYLYRRGPSSKRVFATGIRPFKGDGST